jgi:hypothetical protein
MACNAQVAAHAEGTTPGRVVFDYPGTAKATIEIDINRDMFASVFNIGDGALTGAVNALQESPEGQPGAEAVRETAQRAAAAKELVAIAKDVVNDIHVRVYEDIQADSDASSDMLAHYDKQLEAGSWDSAVRVTEGAKRVRVSLARANDSIKGIFVVAQDGNDLVLVNLTCDISRANAERLANAAVKSGLQAGLGVALDKALNKQ